MTQYDIIIIIIIIIIIVVEFLGLEKNLF